MHSLTKRALLVVALGCFMAVAIPATSARADSPVDEVDFFTRTNQLRASKGLVALSVDSQMTDVARVWSAEMARTDTLAHNPNLKSQITNWSRLGENVGVGPTVESIQDAFEESPGHYANLVEPRYRNVGIGVVRSGDLIWVTVVFKTPASSAAVPPVPNSPPTAPPPRAPQPAPAPRAAPRAVSRPPASPPNSVLAVASTPMPSPAAAKPKPVTLAADTVFLPPLELGRKVVPAIAGAAAIPLTLSGWQLALTILIAAVSLFLYRRRQALRSN